MASICAQVETYVYDIRSKVSEGGSLYEYCPAAVREQLSQLLNETEDWLYGEGEDTTKSVYVAKLAELKKIGGPVERRFHEAQGRAAAVAALQSVIAEYVAEGNSTDDKYAHIDATERQKVLDQCKASETVRCNSDRSPLLRR
jgi:heat shock 70kDa protein 4